MERYYDQSLQVLDGHSLHRRQPDNAPRSRHPSLQLRDAESQHIAVDEARGSNNHGVQQNHHFRRVLVMVQAAPEARLVDHGYPGLYDAKVRANDLLEYFWWRQLGGVVRELY